MIQWITNKELTALNIKEYTPQMLSYNITISVNHIYEITTWQISHGFVYIPCINEDKSYSFPDCVGVTEGTGDAAGAPFTLMLVKP